MNISSRFLSSLLFVVFLFVTTACSSSAVKEESAKSANIGILWEVSRQKVSSCYVFGTMHSEDVRVTRLPKQVNDAFDGAKTLILEMILDAKTSQEVLTALYFTDGRKLKPIIGDALYLRSVSAMKKKDLPEDIVNKMKPWAVFMILNMPEQETGLFMDAILYNNAKKQGKSIFGLETPKEQTEVFDGMSMSSQVSLLKSTLDNMEDMNTLQDEVVDVYLTRDLDQILALNAKYEAMIDEKLAKEFTQRLVVDRNYRMVERMMPMLENGNCFVAVGALHLPGDEGILTLLKKTGFQVHAVY